MQLRKLGGFGAETGDIGAPFQDIWEAFFASQVLVFRAVEFAPADYLAFAKKFGRPEPHVIDQFHYPGHPDILILSNVQKDGQAPTSTPTTRTSTCRRAARCSIRARCRARAATRCSPTSTPPTTTCLRA
jgi:taurine dioxygenase